MPELLSSANPPARVSGKTTPPPTVGNRLALIVFSIGVCAIACAQWFWFKLRLGPGLFFMLTGILFVAISRAPQLLAPGSVGAPSERRDGLAEACFLFALVLAGGYARFFGLAHTPPGGFVDEVQNQRVAERILEGDRPVFIGEAGSSGRSRRDGISYQGRESPGPALFFYWLAGAMAVAGKSLTTVRGFSALFGTLTLPAFYFLARRVFAWPVAAATAILLAGSRWSITFSRVGFLETMPGVLLEILAILCLWKAMESRRRLFFVLLGVVAGVGLQSYYSFNLFPVVMAVAVASFAARNGWKSFGSELRPIVRGLGWSVLTAALLLLPLARFALRNPKVFFERSSTVAIWNPRHNLPWPAILWRNTAAHLLMFNYRGDGNPRHNIPAAPMLNPIEGCLLAVGLGAALARGRKWPEATWLAWFFVMLLPAILTIEAPQALRAAGAIPAVYLLIGQGLQTLFAFAARSASLRRVTLAAAALLVTSLVAAGKDLSLYFGPQVRTSIAWQAFQAEHHAIGRFVKENADRYAIFISPVYFDYNIERFYLGSDFPYKPFRLFEHLPVSPASVRADQEGLLYVLEPFQEGLFPLFQALYEHSRLLVYRDPFGAPMFVQITVPRQDLAPEGGAWASRSGFLGAYYANERWTGDPVIVRREPAIWFHSHWHEDPLPHPFTADWAARVQIDEPGEYAFELDTSGPTVLSFDQTRIFESSTDASPGRATVQASRGEHLLVVSYWEKSFRGIITLSWQPPNGKREVIPLSVLSPLSVQDYARLRDSFPRTRETIPQAGSVGLTREKPNAR